MNRSSSLLEQHWQGLLGLRRRRKGSARAKNRKTQQIEPAVTLLLCLQCLYVSLPALLECNPFQSECRESWRGTPPLPEELRRVVLIYQAVLDLLHQYEVHPEITSQMFAYLFFFSNTLLFNQLLDKGGSSLDWVAHRGLGYWDALQSIPVPPYGVQEGRGWRWAGLSIFPGRPSIDPAAGSWVPIPKRG